ncbi:MAG TPA: aminotransferase class I/II-fold pyridoxal phosphate-dependent enzyme, partial [Gemmataceae bacterium]|nr:aminotransferase class I/II-fold pyridoxal phosphate-dependent enzyme [Gemmataceae bacterium]
SLAAATAAIEDREYMQQTRSKVIAGRERLTAELKRLGFEVTPSQANFVWCRRADRPVRPIYEALKERRILVRYMRYDGYGDGLRISVGSEAEIGQLLDILRGLLLAGAVPRES